MGTLLPPMKAYWITEEQLERLERLYLSTKPEILDEIGAQPLNHELDEDGEEWLVARLREGPKT
jgi:hypothetical protein